MTRIYFVEDNTHLLSDGLVWLDGAAYQAYGANQAKEFDALMAEQLPDIVLLDWMLPGEDGLSIARRLRSAEATQHIGIIFITARNAIEDRIAGLTEADAYISKPFDYRELLAIIRSVARRIGGTSPAIDSWTLISGKRVLISPTGPEQAVSERENIILALLARHSGQIVSAKTIADALDENPNLFEKSRVEMSLSRLRAKLKMDDSNTNNPIRNFRNRGYQLMIPLNVED